MPKTRHSKKWPFLAKNYRLTPLENFDFLEFFFFLKIGFSRLNRIFFYLGHQKRCFLIGFAQKLQIRKITVFGQKQWTNPFGKFRFFGLFLKLVFSCLKIILFFKEYQKTIFPYWLCPKSTNEKNSHFWPNLMD